MWLQASGRGRLAPGAGPALCNVERGQGGCRPRLLVTRQQRLTEPAGLTAGHTREHGAAARECPWFSVCFPSAQSRALRRPCPSLPHAPDRSIGQKT